MGVGIGAIFDTSTKKLTAPLCGIRGLREILKFASSQSPPVRTVAIGGLNAGNIARVIYQSATPCGKAKLDGVAVVSALMSADNPQEAAAALKSIVREAPSFAIPQTWKPQTDFSANSLSSDISRILKDIQKETPLVHHLTNNVYISVSVSYVRLSRTSRRILLCQWGHHPSCPRRHSIFPPSPICPRHTL
jgi:thiamine-phosphate diphosphorylase / hydroxyethylthiazole kinase